MFSFISWSQFFTIITGCIITYYLLVAVIYYRPEIADFFKVKSFNHSIPDLQEENYLKSTSTVGTDSTSLKNPHLNDRQIHELMADLKSLFITATKAKTVREELIMALQMLLREYSDLKSLPVANDIDNYIMSECQNICSITLSEAELKMLWNG